jgi:hypothetical protein
MSMERAGPSPQGIPIRAQRSARQDQVKIHSPATTLSARYGVIVRRYASALAFMC